MSSHMISIYVLALMFVIATVLPINMGVIAFVGAFLVGTLAAGMQTKAIMAGFPAELFLTLVGITFLFAQAQNNGTIDWLVRLALRAVRGRIAAIPPERRVVVTSHDSFGYFGAAYGVRFLAPQGIATGSQPSAAQVAALLRQIRAERVTAVFIDGPGSQAVMERLAREAGVRPRGRLYADTLSNPEGPAPTYEAMQRHNVGLLVAGMRDEAV